MEQYYELKKFQILRLKLKSFKKNTQMLNYTIYKLPKLRCHAHVYYFF